MKTILRGSHKADNILCPNISRIDQHGMIKVADFGLTQDIYDRNYFYHDKSEEGSEEKVPIRWMAPESIENDFYNEKTDVVSIYVHRYFFLGCYLYIL